MQISELVCLELFWDGVDLWIYEGLNCPDIHERVFTALFVVSFPRVHHSEVNLPALLALHTTSIKFEKLENLLGLN